MSYDFNFIVSILISHGVIQMHFAYLAADVSFWANIVSGMLVQNSTILTVQCISVYLRRDRVYINFV